LFPGSNLGFKKSLTIERKIVKIFRRKYTHIIFFANHKNDFIVNLNHQGCMKLVQAYHYWYSYEYGLQSVLILSDYASVAIFIVVVHRSLK